MKKFIVITLVLALAGLIAGLVYSISVDVPEYTSTSLIMVRHPKTANQVRDYASIATSTGVLSRAKIDIDASEDLSTLAKYVTATNLSGTNIINITVITSTAEMSKNLNQSVIGGIQQKSRELYQEDDNIIVVDPASDSRQTRSPRPFVNAIMGIIAGGILGMAIMLIFYPQSREATEHEHQPDHKSTVPIPQSALDSSAVSDGGQPYPNERPVRSSMDAIIGKPVRKVDARRQVARPGDKLGEAEEDGRDLEDILDSLEKKMKRH